MNTTYGHELRRLRELASTVDDRGVERKISLRNLAGYLEMTPTYLSDVERGYRSPFEDEVTIKAAEYIGVDPQPLIRLAIEGRTRHMLRTQFPNLTDDALARAVRLVIKDLQAQGG